MLSVDVLKKSIIIILDFCAKVLQFFTTAKYRRFNCVKNLSTFLIISLNLFSNNCKS